MIKTYIFMNNVKKCPICNENLVNVWYGEPSEYIDNLAKQKEIFYRGFEPKSERNGKDKKIVYHCYNCNMSYSKDFERSINEKQVRSPKRQIEQIINKIALKVIFTLGIEEIIKMIENPEYKHYETGMYIRNKFIYNNEDKPFVIDADALSYKIFDNIIKRSKRKVKNIKNSRIIFYSLAGIAENYLKLTEENLGRINGMMTKCTLKDGKEICGYGDPYKVNEINADVRHVSDYIYLWTFDNLDENSGELIGDDDKKYDKTFEKIYIKDILRVESILYSNPRWGGRLTNKFQFHNNNDGEIKAEIEIPDFLRKEKIRRKNNEDELYYYLTVVYEDLDSDNEYNYISNDTTIEVGDRVLVDRNGEYAVAEVIETGYYNKSNAPFPVELTKNIIKKVDNFFDIKDEILGYNNDFDMDIMGTIFKFGIYDEDSNEDEKNHILQTKIVIKNDIINYSRMLYCSTLLDMKKLLKNLKKLLDNKLNNVEKIHSSYLPDLEFILHPGISEDKSLERYFNYNDIYMELVVNIIHIEGIFICQKYTILFDRIDIEEFVDYLENYINKTL